MAVTVDLDESSQFLMYPERERCRRCRSPFEDLVINRLYCSYPCARKTEPDSDVSTWPRDCRTRTNEPKVRFFWPGAVNADQHEGDTFRLYHCSHCGMYHLGHKKRKVKDDNSLIPAQRTPSP